MTHFSSRVVRKNRSKKSRKDRKVKIADILLGRTDKKYS